MGARVGWRSALASRVGRPAGLGLGAEGPGGAAGRAAGVAQGRGPRLGREGADRPRPAGAPAPALGGRRKKKDLAERIERVRTALREKDEQTNLGASKVTLKGKGIRLTEAIKALQTQSGNAIVDIREANGEEATNPAIDLDIADKPFFEALDLVAEKAGVGFTPYTGDGTIGLIAGAMAAAQHAQARPSRWSSTPGRSGSSSSNSWSSATSSPAPGTRPPPST